MRLPNFSEVRTNVEQVVGSPKNYSVTFELPKFRSVEVAKLENQTGVIPSAGRVQKLFEGSALKGYAAAATTLLAAVLVIGGIGALIGCTGGLAAIAVAVTLFIIGSTTNISYKHPAPPAPEVPMQPIQSPNSRTYLEYFASFLPGYKA